MGPCTFGQLGYTQKGEITVSNIIWIIMIGFIAGIIARVLSPVPNELGGFILTTALGIAGAFVATFIGQTIGWYRLDQGAGLIGATVDSFLCLFGIGFSPPALPRRVIFASLAHRHAAGFRDSMVTAELRLRTHFDRVGVGSGASTWDYAMF
jgi:uncharacterized membrane protein YeaQ/YmgE (transglycosylase-associated protein family)